MKKENEIVYKSKVNDMGYNHTDYTDAFKYIYPFDSIIHAANIRN